MLTAAVFLAALASPADLTVVQNRGEGDKQAICSGSFVAEGILLTAWHCVNDTWPTSSTLYGRHGVKKKTNIKSAAEFKKVDLGLVYGVCVPSQALDWESYDEKKGDSMTIRLWNGRSIAAQEFSTTTCTKYDRFDEDRHVCLKVSPSAPLDHGTSGSPLIRGNKLVGVFVMSTGKGSAVAVKLDKAVLAQLGDKVPAGGSKACH